MDDPAGNGDQQGVLGEFEGLQRSSEFQDAGERPEGCEHAADHLALLYENRTEQFSVAVPFVRRGLERGDLCLYIAGENPPEDVIEELSDAGVDTDAAVESGALRIRSVRETYLRDGTFDPEDSIGLLEDALEEGTADFEGVRVLAEEAWLLEEGSAMEEFMALEARVNELFGDAECTVLCQYNRDRFPAATIHDVIRTHPQLIFDGTIYHNAYYTPPEEFLGPERYDRKVEQMLGTLREQTETRTELRQRERQLRTVVENLPGMVYRCRNEPGWPMEFVSGGCRELTGYDAAALEAGDVSYGADVVHEADREALRSDVRRGLEEDGSFLVTYRVTTADGDVRWVRERGRGVSTGTGTPDALEGVIIDVTEQKRLEAELDEILGRITDGFFALDDEFRFTHVNERTEDLLEAPEADLLGEELWELHPEAAENDDVQDAYRTAMETQEPASYEAHYGSLERWIEATVYPSETGVSVYFQDVTDRRESQNKLEMSERLYRTLVENFPNGVVGVYDADLRYTLVEGSILDEIELAPETVEGSTVEDVLPEAAANDVAPLFRAAIEEGETGSIQTEYAGRTWRIWATPLRDFGGEIFAGLSFALDVTERVERERQLQATNQRLEQFAYAASHDLQEPLRMVSSYLQLIEDRYVDELDEEVSEFLEFAVEGADRMREMVDGLLEYSRIERRGDTFESVDLEAVLADARTELEAKIEGSGAEITADPLPRVEADEGQLREVFRNLLENAIEYSGDDRPVVHISADREGGEWIITVEDEGIGVDPDHADRIFEVFQRLHTHEEHSGTGIGLALCERIVQRHGGEIWVESELGEGAAFRFTLPADREHDPRPTSGFDPCGDQGGS